MNHGIISVFIAYDLVLGVYGIRALMKSLLTVNPYNLNEILNRFDQQSPKEVSIKELHDEVRQYRKEIKELRQFTCLGLFDL